jgi:hypothetical protein
MNRNRVWTSYSPRDKERDRASSGGAANILFTHDNHPDIVENIRDFTNFKRLRIAYDDLCRLPLCLFQDWIVCCMDHIQKDIVGNTPEENEQNHRITGLFHNFQTKYTLIMTNPDFNDELRISNIHDELLTLLRSILGKPCRLSNELLNLTGYPIS